MDDAERIWREKSDDDLIEAAADLGQFTDAGREFIRAELRRRGLEDPVEQAGSETEAEGDGEPEPELQCLRCLVSLRPIDTIDSDGNPRWTWNGPRSPVFDPTVSLRAYVCPRCGHVELFMNVPVEERTE